MGTRIANRIFITIQIIGWMTITAVMGLIVTVIVASICGSLGLTS